MLRRKFDDKNKTALKEEYKVFEERGNVVKTQREITFLLENR